MNFQLHLNEKNMKDNNKREVRCIFNLNWGKAVADVNGSFKLILNLLRIFIYECEYVYQQVVALIP